MPQFLNTEQHQMSFKTQHILKKISQELTNATINFFATLAEPFAEFSRWAGMQRRKL